MESTASNGRSTTDRVVMLVKDLGFPIAVAGYLLYRFDGLMTTLTAQVQQLSVNVEKLISIYQNIGIR